MTEPETISADEYNATYAGKQPKTNKYNARKTPVDGIMFDSKKEAHRYEQLRWMLQSGEIFDLRLQPRWPIHVNGMKICNYTGDFSYLDRGGHMHIEDVKGVRTRDYVLRKKLMKAVWDITVEEV